MRRQPLLAAAVVGLFTLSVLPALGAPLPAPRVAAAEQTPDERYERQAVAATNARREDARLRPLRTDRCLERFAVQHAEAMAAERRMFHGRLLPALRRCGLEKVDQNVGFGYGDGRAMVNRGWMNSPSHRDQLLARDVTLVAVAARRADGEWYVAQMFGRP